MSATTDTPFNEAVHRIGEIIWNEIKDTKREDIREMVPCPPSLADLIF